MTENQMLVIFTTAGIGMGAIFAGVLGRAGYARSMYLIRIPGIYGTGYMYAAIPVGIGFVWITVSTLLYYIWPMGDVYGCITSACIILGIVLAVWQPEFLKPWWIAYLDDNYNILERDGLMDVASDNPKEFTKLTPDEASLKAWADETLNEIYGDEEEEEAEDM